jgi:hypothetical protein
MVQATRAHAETAAHLATLVFETGSAEEARQIGAEALQALAAAPEPSFALEEFLAAWRKNSSAKPGAV